MILTVHSDPALLLTHRLQKDPIQHATGYCPADWDDRVQILRGQRRVGLQPREHLRPRQRLRGSSGRRGELHGVPGGRAGGGGAGSLAAGKGRRRGHQHRSGGGGSGRRSPPSPPPTARGPGAAAHLQAEGGTRAGRRVQRGPERRRDPAQVRVRRGRGAPGSAGSPHAPA